MSSRRPSPSAARVPLALLGAASLAGCATPAEDPLDGLIVVAEDPSEAPLPGLSEEWTARFAEGDALFHAPARTPGGLGPVYIRDNCGACHEEAARGPGRVQKMAVLEDDPGDLLPYGHTVRPYTAGGATTPLLPPEDERVLVTTRLPLATFGRGYLEAVADDTFEALAAHQAKAGLVHGRVNHVTCAVAENPDSSFVPCEPGATVVGRFGLKARTATLDAFTAEAFLGDISLTSPLLPDELPNPDGLVDDDLPGVDLTLDTINAVADYVRLQAIPAREPSDTGPGLFAAAGCAECHVPTLPTRADWPLDALAGVDAPLYTDGLLHDWGEAFSDGLPEGEATASEWRTAPLLGLRFFPAFLHDGRAATVEEAILLHTADAAFAVDRYTALSDSDRADLLSFVESL